ncbi:Pkinase-domain-containing protein [Cristinia sonorae]|uniref:Pkinase-domain-containing protein n=1 Tax=Cristinia sonorae TaxID=1940300 RepID=A0A8K0UPI9_9AGAR|nr:Pkinase-domain-containing protein [Cristinia sonorae]
MHPNNGHQGHAQHHPNENSHPPNGHNHHPNGSSSHRNHAPKDPITVVGIPSVTVQNDLLVVGGSQSSSTRSYTPLKVVGDGSFGTVWLCDWHGTLPPNTPMSAMQCGAGARPEYANKRLVAVKRMKKRWEGGWDECKRLKELESLRAIPYHPNIIPLYDFFLLPSTKELYFVFESMEGNLYQLIKTRKGKPLAGGLVSSIFKQVVSGLHHIHAAGYFHRDMKPENLLVTTTGLHDYRPVYDNAPPDAPSEPDVVVIIKLADFGLAREIRSKPPYTEYVSTRWYRAPEVLLKSRDYSAPVDMWALGTIMAELVNLRPLFPGNGEIDQVARICELLGDPVDDYGVDRRGACVGGGKWPKGVKMAKAVGFAFQKIQPKSIYALFDRTVPLKLVDCISDLLKYDPDLRLNSRQCLDHPYLLETTPLNHLPPPPMQPPSTLHHAHRSSRAHGVPIVNGVNPRNVPPSHSLGARPHAASTPHIPPHIPDASSSHRSQYYDPVAARSRTVSDISQQRHGLPPAGPYTTRLQEPQGVPVQGSSERFADWSHSENPQARDWDAMDVTPHVEIPQDRYVSGPHAMDIQTSPMAQEYPARPPPEQDAGQEIPISHPTDHVQVQGNKFPKLSFGKKPGKWVLGSMFGHSDKHSQQILPPVHENTVPSADSTPSLQRTSSSADSHSLPEFSPTHEIQPPPPHMDEKARRKEAQRVAEEAERQRRARVREMQMEQARAVMHKRRLVEAYSNKTELNTSREAGLLYPGQTHLTGRAHNRHQDKGKQASQQTVGPIRQTQSHGPSSPTVQAAGGHFLNASNSNSYRTDWHSDLERVPKARRREYDDDHSMSSSDMPSGISVISFATVDSDPGPTRSRHRPNAYGMSRMASLSSLRPGSYDDFPTSTRSSTSLSLEQQLVNDFHLRASVDSASLSDGGSPQPPPMHMLSLSSPIPWARTTENSSNSTVDNRSLGSGRQTLASPIMSPPPHPPHPNFHQGLHSPYDASNMYGQPPSPNTAPKSAINPIFKVPQAYSPSSGSADKPTQLSLTALPPFSQLEAVADGEYPPLSPMSFTIPEDSAEDS